MKTYFIKFRVLPTEANKHYNLVRCGLAFCWVVDHEDLSAFNRTIFFLKQYDWVIDRVETRPVETNKEHFLENELALEQYNKAQANGIAVVFEGFPRKGIATSGPIELKPSFIFNRSGFLDKQKKLRNKGR